MPATRLFFPLFFFGPGRSETSLIDAISQPLYTNILLLSSLLSSPPWVSLSVVARVRFGIAIAPWMFDVRKPARREIEVLLSERINFPLTINDIYVYLNNIIMRGIALEKGRDGRQSLLDDKRMNIALSPLFKN